MDFIEVAKIINTHGIRGAVKIFLLTSNVDRFKMKCTFYIDMKIPVTVKKIMKISKDTAVLEFNEFNNINDIMMFKNLGIYVEESDIMPLPEGEYYIFKLIGMDVYNQDSVYIGKISNVISTLANDVYEVNHNGKMIYIPAVKDYIIEVDEIKSTMRVNIISGMLDD